MRRTQNIFDLLNVHYGINMHECTDPSYNTDSNTNLIGLKNVYNNLKRSMIMSKPNLAQGNVRPGLKAERSNEFTLIMKLKPGGAERLRKKLASLANKEESLMDRVGTVHDLRFTIFDNDTKLLFASTFDGDWDAYIDDFASQIPDALDLTFGEAEDYPGIRSPNIKDYIVKNQVTSTFFYSAYPDASVRDIKKAMKIKSGLDVLLDAASS